MKSLVRFLRDLALLPAALRRAWCLWEHAVENEQYHRRRDRHLVEIAARYNADPAFAAEVNADPLRLWGSKLAAMRRRGLIPPKVRHG